MLRSWSSYFDGVVWRIQEVRRLLLGLTEKWGEPVRLFLQQRPYTIEHVSVSGSRNTEEYGTAEVYERQVSYAAQTFGRAGPTHHKIEDYRLTILNASGSVKRSLNDLTRDIH